MSKAIDLNLDAGESLEALQSGFEERLYQQVTSVNIACGGHTGDRRTMLQSIELALRYGLAIGAHPSFPDQEGFGRRPLSMPSEQLLSNLRQQIESLAELCDLRKTKLRHVKPHGALYNLAARDMALADVVIESVRQTDSSLILVGLANSALLHRAKSQGLKTAHEAFVDRRYEENGQLRARQFADALIEDSSLASDQAVGLAEGRGVHAVDGSSVSIEAQTLCIHGDTRHALEIAQAVRLALIDRGFQLRSLSGQ